MFVTDCATLTFANCAKCGDFPVGTNDTNPCEECADGYVLRDQLQMGENAGCVCKLSQQYSIVLSISILSFPV